MMLHHERGRAPGKCLLVLAGVLLAGLTTPVCAQDKKIDSSLSLIPADAAYYSAMLRNREQFDAAAKSKAWAKIKALPAYQMAVAAFNQQYSENGSLAPLYQWAQQADNKELLDVLAEAVSDEMFCYGGSSLIDFMNLYSQINMARYLGPVQEIVRKGNVDGEQVSKGQIRAVLRVLARNPDKVRFPDFVLGFKLANAKKAEAQIKRLETHLNAFAAQEPMLEGRVKRVKVGTGDFLTLNLDGSMLPWDPATITDLAEAAGEFDGVVKQLKAIKLTLALGVRDQFLLFSFGPSTDVLATLGTEGKRLSALPELKPLMRAADKRLTGISYTSKAMAASGQMNQKDVDVLSRLARQGLEAAGVPEAKRKEIEKDVNDLASGMKKNMPEPGANLSYSYLSERGYEGYTYQYGQSFEQDSSKPLTLLDHVGGDPILAAVGRSRGSLDDYLAFSKWVKKFYGHIEPLIVDKLDKDQKEKYEQVSKVVLPLLRRLDEVTGQMLLPALADGQAGFVLDAKWKSKQWHAALPSSSKELPMLELALLVGVSDSDLLEKAMKSYKKIIEDAVAQAKELAPPDTVLPLKIPDPEVKTVTAGKLFVFRLPAEWKLDPQVAPTAGLSSRVGVLTLSAGHAERLLTSTPLKVEGGPLADTKRPLAGAVYFNWPVFVDAVRPWVLFGVEQAQLEKQMPGQDVLKQVRTVLDVLKVFRMSTSATYIESGALITHSETVIRDE
jgi:hypothetical protein